MIATAIQFTSRVGYVADTGLPVHRLAGDHPQPWMGNSGTLHRDDQVTEVTDTQELHVDERVLYRRTHQYAIVRHANWVNLDTGWLYKLAVINGGEVYSTALHLERLTVRIGDFVEGRHVISDTRHHGRVTEILRPAPFSTGGVAYRLDQTGEFYLGGEPVEVLIIFDEFLYPLVGE